MYVDNVPLAIVPLSKPASFAFHKQPFVILTKGESICNTNRFPLDILQGLAQHPYFLIAIMDDTKDTPLSTSLNMSENHNMPGLTHKTIFPNFFDPHLQEEIHFISQVMFVYI